MSDQAKPAITSRAATRADTVFLAAMDYEATRAPFERSFIDDLLEGTGTQSLAFLQAVLENDASNWGVVEDFIVLEVAGRPAACCAVYRPAQTPDLRGPLNLNRLPAVAAALGWSDEVTEDFRARYLKDWGRNDGLFEPQAEMIVETVAVAPAYRGQGLGRKLMEAAFEVAKQKGAASLGIMVVHGNDPARMLYEKFFEPYASFHASYFDHQFPGLTKFRASLAA